MGGEEFMNVSRKNQTIVWSLWAILFLVVNIYAIIQFPPIKGSNVGDFTAFIIVAIIAGGIPIVLKQIPFSITQWISLVVFMEFGLLAELILGQIIVLSAMVRLRLTKDRLFAFPLNSIMYFVMSLSSAAVFYLLGGVHGIGTNITNIQFIIPAAGYLVAYLFSNYLIYYLINNVLYQRRTPFFTDAFKWESVIVLIVFPVSLLLYYLYNMIGIISLVFVSFPVICCQILLHFYNKSNQMNDYLQRAAELGHQLTERLQANEILNIFIEKLIDLFPIDYLYVFDNKNNEKLELIRSYEKGVEDPVSLDPIVVTEGIIGKAWKLRKPLLYKTKVEWLKDNKVYFPFDMESGICVPMVKSNEVTGVLFIGSEKKRIYEKYHVMILDILCSYLAVALDNARHYEETKYASERDSLTNLYNARVFTNRIEEAFRYLQTGEWRTVSLLIVDIDHFKKVNDTYGHQSGDAVLIQVAKFLEEMVGDRGLLARYGGEEFVVLLPNMDKNEARDFGEWIRRRIEDEQFVIYNDLADERQEVTVYLTVSIGLANAPDDTDEEMSLIRCADRALYLGAKQVGRNRVAEYVK